MFIGKFGHLTSTGSTLHKSFFYQERFVNFLNGSRIFSQSRGNGSDTYRTTFKFVYNGAKYLVVYLIQAVLINIQCFQCKLGDAKRGSSMIETVGIDQTVSQTTVDASISTGNI